MKEFFRKISAKIANAVGSAYAFLLAFTIIVVWGISGPIFGFSDTWQLVINTGTTIVTFLMVFIIQNTQNRDSKVIHLQLDELIHASKGARNTFVDLGDLTDEELSLLDDGFRNIHTKLHTTPVVKKLHSSIEAEKYRRLSLSSAEHAISAILKAPLNAVTPNTKKPEKDK